MAVATLSLASCVAVRRTRSTVRPTRTMATRASFVPIIARAPKVALKPQLRSANVSAIRAAAPRVNVARRTIVTKAAEAAVATEGKKSNTLQLGLYFAGWYAFNIYFNIYNKQVLKVFPFPWTCTLIQFFGGIIVSALLWGSTLVKAPKFGEVEVPEVASDSTPEAIAAAKKAEEEDNKLVSVKQLYMILPLALVHTLGNLLTNVSLGKVAVSFTHTIKAMEPFFSVLLSSIFLGDAPSMLVIGSLLPIVGGVALASVSEVSFNWVGFLAAMGSNITFQSRNVLSKKLMTGKAKKGLNQINLFSIITCMSFFLLLPFTLAVEGFQVAGPFMTSEIARRLCYSSLCFHSYQLVSYLILGLVSPVTHSVGNCVKRVVVIIASVIFFQSPVSPMNAVGTAIALAGVFAYSQVKRLEGKKKA